MGWSERTAWKHVYYQGWNRSPAQVGCMRQGFRASALGRSREIGWRGRWEGGSGWGIHVNPWLIHVNVWQKPLQYCKVISLQLIKINGKNNICINRVIHFLLYKVRVIYIHTYSFAFSNAVMSRKVMLSWCDTTQFPRIPHHGPT